MEEIERDFVTFTDEEGHELELDVLDYFEHEGEVYAVLTDLNLPEQDAEADADTDSEYEQELYIFKVVENGDTEEFLPADEDKMDALTAIVEALLAEEPDCDEEGCEGCDGCES
ncbi:MAG: DUF1292 domain-containing protein [Christensenellaceae bacterium]|jgi:hypothetical protein|nr:DUF1292 domain-containing protein [Christensenellaceae bacterium]